MNFSTKLALLKRYISRSTKRPTPEVHGVRDRKPQSVQLRLCGPV